MRNISTEFKQLLFNNNRHYINKVDFTLADGTSFTVDNTGIIDSGIEIDDAISQDNDFTALGSVAVNSCKLSIYNNATVYSDYIFEYAEAVVYTGLQLSNGDTERIKLGTFTVDEATYGDFAITLSLMDHMSWFDRDYSESNLTYPATLGEIVRDACGVCLGSSSKLATQQFPHNDYLVQEFPTDKSYNFREVVGWCATIAGCYARCNANGELEFKWFNTSALESQTVYDGGTFEPWTAGNTVDGGTFNPWSTGSVIDAGDFTTTRNVHYINSLYTQNIGVDDVVITGVRIVYSLNEPDENNDDTAEALAGTTDYIIEIKDNPFITEDTVNTVLGWLSTLLIGLRFRQCNVEHLSDPSIEAGDVGFVWDTKGIEHPILITRVNFKPTAPQVVVCGASSVSKASSVRFSEQTRSYAELRKQFRKKYNTYDQALDDLRNAVANASGLYKTEVPDEETGAVVTYYHNKPELADSDIQIVISDVGITVTSNGTDEEPIWYGLRVNGELISSIMSAIGINFDWGVGGSLVIADENGIETFYANADTGIVRIKATQFSLANGDTINSIARDIFDEVEIGGRNLVLNTADSVSITGTGTTTEYDFSVYAKRIISDASAVESNKITVSFDYETTGTGECDIIPFINGSQGHTERQTVEVGTKGHYVVEGKTLTSSQVPPRKIAIRLSDTNADTTLVVSNLKVECGEKETDWTPAPEDIEQTFNNWITGDYADTIQEISGQIDKKIETFYQTADPSVEWTTTTLQTAHKGDIWFCTSDEGTYAQKTWQWSGTQWEEMRTTPPSDVLDTIDGKAQVFVSQPVPPYAVGDLWVQGSTGDIYKCKTAKVSGIYASSDWELASKYTDDSALTAFQNGTYATFVTNTNTELNNRTTTYYQASAPTNTNTGDLWIDTDDGNKLYRYDGTDWVAVQDEGIQQAMEAAGFARAVADGKIMTYAQTTAPESTSELTLDIGDLWIDTDDNNKMYRWNGSTWIAYSDSSALQTWIQGDFATTINSVRGQIDQKAETWYQTSDPSVNWNTTELQNAHIGDLWYCTATSGNYENNQTYRWSGTAWVKQTAPTEVFDAIDGKAQIFIATPTPPYNEGDLWFNSNTSDIMTCTTARTSGSYNVNDWEKRNKYTDDSAVATLNADLDQEEIFNRLTNNGQAQGINLANGNLYINATYVNSGTMSAARIKGGLLEMGGNDNVNGRIIIRDASNEIVGRWDKDGIDVLKGVITLGGSGNVGKLIVNNESGTEIGRWDKNGISVLSGSITGSTITLGGYNNENGALYLKGSDGTTNLMTLGQSGIHVYAGTIQGPNVIVGGDDNENGQIIVRNASNAVIGRWNKDGITVTTGSISGNLITTGKIQAANGSAYFDLDNDILVCNQLKNGGNTLIVSTESLLGASESSFKFSRGYDSRAIHICPTTAIPFIACKTQLNVCKIDANGNQKGYISLDNGYVDLGFGNDSLLELVSTGKIVTGGSVTQVDLPDNTRVYRNSAYAKVAIVSSSSKRYKHDINYELTDDRAEDNLLSLPVAEFVFNDDHAVQYADMRGKTIPGIIAEDVAEIYPSAAIYNEDNEVESWDERRLIPPMLKLIQEQHTKIEEQQAEIDDLKQRLERLERLLL